MLSRKIFALLVTITLIACESDAREQVAPPKHRLDDTQVQIGTHESTNENLAEASIVLPTEYMKGSILNGDRLKIFCLLTLM